MDAASASVNVFVSVGVKVKSDRGRAHEREIQQATIRMIWDVSPKNFEIDVFVTIFNF